MRIALATRERLIYLKDSDPPRLVEEVFLDPEGKPRWDQLAHRVRDLGGADYLGLGPGFTLLRLGTFPSLPGYPLDEAVLAEAERSPLFSGEDLIAQYFPLASPSFPPGEALGDRRARVLYGAMPRRGAELLARRLRPRRVEPLPLILWRWVKERSGTTSPLGDQESVLVVENLSHSVALFVGGGLVGFRHLTLPADDGSERLTDEIVRSLGLFGWQGEVGEAWVVGLPSPPPVPPALPARRVESAPALPLEGAALAEPFFLDLRPRRKGLGEGLPKEGQLALFLSALVLSLSLVGVSYLRFQEGRLREAQRRLESQRDLLQSQMLRPTRPQGVGLAELFQVAQARPGTAWLTRLEVGAEGITVQGKALDPYAPLRMAQALSGQLRYIRQEAIGSKTAYAWEVQIEKAATR